MKEISFHMFVCATAYSEGVEKCSNTGIKQWHESGKELVDLKTRRRLQLVS